MKLEKKLAVRIVKRQHDGPAPEKRMTEVDSQETSLSKMQKTVRSWFKEFRNKLIVELQLRFSKFFGGATGFPCEAHMSARLPSNATNGSQGQTAGINSNRPRY